MLTSKSWWAGLALIGLLSVTAQAQTVPGGIPTAPPAAPGPQSSPTPAPITRGDYTYQYGGFNHVDRLAGLIRVQSNELAWELHNFHRGRPGFKDVYREVKDVYATSGYLRDLLAGNGSQERIRRAVADLDNELHEVTLEFEDWRSATASRHGLDDLIERIRLLDLEMQNLLHDVGVQSQFRTAPATTNAPINDGSAPEISNT